MTQSPKRVFFGKILCRYIRTAPRHIYHNCFRKSIFLAWSQEAPDLPRLSSQEGLCLFFFLSQPNPIPYSILSITHSPSHDGLGTGKVRPGATPPSPCGRDGGKAGAGVLALQLSRVETWEGPTDRWFPPPKSSKGRKAYPNMRRRPSLELCLWGASSSARALSMCRNTSTRFMIVWFNHS